MTNHRHSTHLWNSLTMSGHTKPLDLLDITNYSIKVIEDEETCEMYLQEHYYQAINFIGMDCEWTNRKGSQCHPVALLQLAFTNKACALVRLYKFTSLPPSLVKLLQDRR